MYKSAIEEQEFIVAIKEALCGGYFGYSIVEDTRVAFGNNIHHNIIFSLDYGKSPFSEELAERGIDMGISVLRFRINYYPKNKSIVRMYLFTPSGYLKIPPVLIDSTAIMLLQKSYENNYVGGSANYLKWLIEKAVTKAKYDENKRRRKYKV